MQPTYRAAPAHLCYAPAKTFPTALEACLYARAAADAYRVGYQVYEVLAGRVRRVAAYEPQPVRA